MNITIRLEFLKQRIESDLKEYQELSEKKRRSLGQFRFPMVPNPKKKRTNGSYQFPEDYMTIGRDN